MAWLRAHGKLAPARPEWDPPAGAKLFASNTPKTHPTLSFFGIFFRPKLDFFLRKELTFSTQEIALPSLLAYDEYFGTLVYFGRDFDILKWRGLVKI